MALDVLLGPSSWPQPIEADDPLLGILSAYLGETLRQAHQGRWSRLPGSAARVVVGYRGWTPEELIANRFKYGQAASIRGAVPSALLNPGSGPWQHQVLNPIVPSWFGKGASEPAPEALPRLAQHFASGIVGLCSDKLWKQPLDGSTKSLDSLERYLELLAPTSAPIEPDAPWARPVAIWAGAYYGEVLASTAEGVWAPATESTGFARYRILVRGAEIHPIEAIFQRLCSARGQKLIRPGPPGPTGAA
jgi:hypothetical protein